MWTIKGIIAGVFIRACKLFPLNSKKVIFVSYYGKYYNDSPKMIYEEMVKRHPEYDYYWILNSGNPIYGAKTLKNSTFAALYHLSTAKLWVDNCRKPYWVSKRKGQFYIQTWHGTVALKHVEKDAEKTLDPYYVKSGLHDSEMIDAFISSSEWSTKLYRNSFWYDGEIVETGLPRSDVLFMSEEQARRKVSKFYDIDAKTNYVVYAPTFRNTGNLDCYNIDYHRLLDCLKIKFGGNWKIIVRLHPNVAEKMELIRYDNEILNGSKYEDLNELIVCARIVISDYSSCIFDAIEINKVTVIYAVDIEQYSMDRGSYFDLNDLPVSITRNMEELVNLVNRLEEKAYVEKYKLFSSEINSFNDGQASKRILDYIDRKVGLNQTKI